MSYPQAIAIDGPAGSGKSTVAQQLAKRLGYLWFDTGVMYRAVTLAGLRTGAPLDDDERLTQLSKRVSIDVHPSTHDDGRPYTVLLDGEDVTWALRTPEVDSNVSVASACPGVRAALLERQREIARRGRVIMVGRDIGTVVLPGADLKIYLEASAEERARRRLAELKGRGKPADYDQVLAAIRERDRLDSTRAVSPTRPAADAVRVDSTGMNLAAVVDTLEGLVRAWDEDG